LHGEEDPQIPVAQAVVLWRGLRRLSRFPDQHVLAVYPREGHVFGEKPHLEDGLERILRHLENYLK
jgi:dipeptidyl aminopeptidase/acylaminoacyl peptidase